MRIVCFGDSLTTCGGENGRFSDVLQDRFPEHEFLNAGSGGETFEDARERLASDVLALYPDIVLLEFGANDWWRDERPYGAWAGDLEELIVKLKAGGSHVIVLGVFGLYRDDDGRLVPKTYGIDDRAVTYREQEQRIAEKHGCDYIANIQETVIDRRCCWRDRNHPNEYGNRHVADIIAPMLTPLLGSDPIPVRRPTLRTTRDLWDEAVALAPEATAVVHGSRRLTFAEAEAQVRGLASGLHALARGDRVRAAVLLPNCVEYFLTYWAVQKVGGVIIPINTWLKDDSLAAVFRNTDPDVVVVQNDTEVRRLSSVAAGTGTSVFCVNPSGSGGGARSFTDLFGAGEDPPRVVLNDDDTSIIMHTSGTTAAPKGAIMRHCDLLFNVMTTVNAHQFCPSDVHLLVNPMFHCTALYSSLTTAAYQKAPVVITADTTPDGLMSLVQAEGITTFLTVPSILQRIVAMPNLSDYDWSSIRLFGYAGSPMPVKTIRQLQEMFPEVALHNFFGLTETISMTHVLRGGDAEERPDSIGRLLPFVEAIVVDEALNPVHPGTVGELLFGRENVICGYVNQPGKLEESVVTLEGREWFRTGDLASVDEEGYFFIKGRKKDMIIVGGENVFSAEVEAVLLAHGNIREAAVKGVPATGIRASLGEMIKAFVVPDQPPLGETEVRKHCHARLPSYKIPHLIEFRDSLPRNPSGKVLKSELD